MNELARGSLPDEAALWRLLCRTARSYTRGDSDSLPEETMEELLRSLCFTLGRCGMEDIEDARLKLRADVEMAKRLWAAVCQTCPPLESESLQTSLRSIGGFFDRYDTEYLAHEIPCMIDYPLLLPVSDSLLGVDWIRRYLEGLRDENAFLNRFSPEAMRGALALCGADWREMPVNLCQPILACALALTVLDQPPAVLKLTRAQQERLLTVSDWPAALTGAAKRLALSDYLLQASREFLPRLQAGGLRGVFPAE